MSNAVVPYEQLEKMAKTVVASKLFGVKSPEEAMTLMLIAQAEGIHPMTAMRDFHIIQGRPSMKAETMLARFQQAGGKVEWHELSDTKAEATFSHPAGGSVRIDWTLERAKQAGLSARDMWKSYPRPMLRSRLISEGVRTVCPQIVQSVYTPDEILDQPPELPVSKEQRIESFDKARMLNDVADDWIFGIQEASDVPALKRVFGDAYKAAKALDDTERMQTFQVAYESRKGELNAPIEGSSI